MGSNKRKTTVYFLLSILAACFLTFGTTRAYMEQKNTVSVENFFGTYSMFDGEEYYISISVSPKGDAPENEGSFRLLDKSAKIVSEGSVITSDDGVITIHREDGIVEEICVLKDKIYYFQNNREPVEIIKLSDEPL